jgi:gamma-glutamyltranspeptidase/glutathione hydrolase
MGHPVRSVSGMGRSVFGRGQVILRDPLTGVLTAGSDPRADGCAMTLS